MLGFVSERLPKTGALGLAIMGGAGMLSAGYMVPVIGKSYDQGIASRIPEGSTVDALKGAAEGSPLAKQWMEIQSGAGLEALGKVAVLPVILFVVFILILLLDKRSREMHAEKKARKAAEA